MPIFNKKKGESQDASPERMTDEKGGDRKEINV